MPLCDLFGGRTRGLVEFMYFVYRDDLGVMIAEARAAVAAGFETIYVKVGVEPSDDIEIVLALRDALGPSVRLRADANEAWSVFEAIDALRRFEDVGVDFLAAADGVFQLLH